MDDDDYFIFEIHFGRRFKNLNGVVYVNGDVIVHDEPFDSDCLSMFELESILGKYEYQLSAADVDDCIPLTPTLPEVLVVDKSKRKGKGKESGTSNKRDKLPIIGRKNKNKSIKITDRQPLVKRKEKEVANRSKGKGKEKIFEVFVKKEYDADDDVDCVDFDNENEAGLEVEDEGFELDLWDGLLSGDEDLLDAAVVTYSQGMTSQPASQLANQTVTDTASETITIEVREPENEKDWHSEMPNSDELITPLATSDEEKVPKGQKPKSVEFDVIDMSNPVLENGMKFADVYQFREAVREYNLKIGKDLSFVKNDKDKDIGEVAGGWTFISDRQKGLTKSFKDVCPDMDHRTCVRHIYANFRDSGYRGKALKDKLWGAASSYTEFEFDAHMAELKKLSPPTYEYLSKIPVATWSMSKFTKNSKSDLIVNHLSECFNSYILDARDKPILTMLDTIRRKLMRRFQVNRVSIAKMSEKLCPKIQVKVEKAGGSKIEDYVEHCYTIEKYKKSYEPIIHLVPSIEQWTQTQYDPVDPPLERCHPDRPKRMRKRDPIEPSNPYSGQAVVCGRLASAGGATGNASGATGTAGATGTGSKGKKKSVVTVGAGTGVAAGTVTGAAAGIGTAAATGTVAAATGTSVAAGTAAAGGAASKKAKVVVVPTVEKAMTRIAAKKQKIL
uniref:Transposase MuDR plant domain-containing protein n=1 Tax=Fagus sylvatica TaxID=28930 RepID=A0A2N9IJF0_FAGSY